MLLGGNLSGSYERATNEKNRRRAISVKKNWRAKVVHGTQGARDRRTEHTGTMNAEWCNFSYQRSVQRPAVFNYQIRWFRVKEPTPTITINLS